MLNIGWVDFSKSDRDMVFSVLQQFTEPGATDELGIGTIRDAFSDILFPGTSTIQTRAKYLFLIPYICLELERRTKLQPHDFIEALEQEELSLIKILNKKGAEGVIGSRSKQTLKRKPSSIYWNALRTYGIFAERLTLSEYAAILCSRLNIADKQRESGKRYSRFDEDTVDDADAVSAGATFWRVPIPNKDWRDNVTIDLTANEAKFLHNKIISMPKTKDSLLALVLRENRFDFTEYAMIEDIATLHNIMPPSMWSDYSLACDFSRFVYGAQIRYNVIYSGGQSEEANELWEQYIEERPTVDLSKIATRLKPKKSVIHFLKRFQASLDDSKALDSLIIKRECELKGVSRSKLTNKELYRYDGSQIVNMVPLYYRMYNTQRFVNDIFNGMNKDV